jgi:predicted deacylase
MLTELPTGRLAPGRHRLRLPVTTALSGMDVAVDAIVHEGVADGPTLTLLAGVHGNEWQHLFFFQRLDEELPRLGFRGRVVLVPMANALAFGTLSRNIRDDSDAPDVNRLFPGGARPQIGLAEQIATVIADGLLRHSDALLDFHLGIWGSTLGSTIVGSDLTDESVRQRSQALAKAYGVPLVFQTRMLGVFPGPRAAQAYVAEVLKIPSCGSFLGGAGFAEDLEDGWTEANHRGVINVMRSLDMLDGEPELPERYLVYESIQRVNPRKGGLLVPVNRRDTFGREVREGELLGHVLSPFSLEPIEELRSPMDGYLGYWARSYPVHPGDWAFAVVPADHPGTRWVSAEEF